MTTREAISFCRICSGGCGTILTIDEQDHILSVRGDPHNPLTAGYACFKGLQAEEAHHGPARLLHPLKRLADGTQVRIGSEQALDEISDRLRAIIDQHGPNSVAVFCGNGSMFSAAALAMHRSFLAAIGSDQYFSTLTIDQSAKYVSFGRLGGWAAGYPNFEDMEAVLMFGANPLVSHGSLSFLSVDPVKRLKRAKAKGLKLIVVDPRRTETARNADLALHPFPGQDAAIAGAIIRLVLEEGWEDKAFCEAHVGAERMADLRAAVDPLTPDMVEVRAGLEPGQIRAVAEMFARDTRVRATHGATGPAMQPFSNLAQHMIDCLNMICGGYLREGQAVHGMNAMGAVMPVHAEVIPPLRQWEAGGESRIRGARLIYGERPTATMTDEILTPGKDQIRALILGGGNPLTSFPDQARAAKALRALDLLVLIEPWPTPTASLADYVLPPRMQYERADLPLNLPGYACWPGTWTQYTPPLMAPPPGSDVMHDWYAYWAIARRLGVTIDYAGKGPLDMENRPDCDDVLAHMLRDAPISLDEIKRHPHGLHVDIGAPVVQPPRAETAAFRFDPMPADVADELRRFLKEGQCPGLGDIRRDGKVYSHLLTTRRMRDLFNSNGRNLRTVRKRTPYNPAFLHPDDLAALGIVAGDSIELVSSHGRVVAIAGADADLRRGVVSMAHGWGAVPGSNEGPQAAGTAVNALIDTDRNFETINAMPHMSAVPVNIVPLRGDIAKVG